MRILRERYAAEAVYGDETAEEDFEYKWENRVMNACAVVGLAALIYLGVSLVRGDNQERPVQSPVRVEQGL